MARRLTKFLCVFAMILCFPALAAADDPAPAINPLGDMGAYTDTSYSENSSTLMRVPSGGGMHEQSLKGDLWYLKLDPGDRDQASFRQQLMDYVKSLGAEVLRDDAAVVVFRKDMGEGEIWWCKAELEYGMQLTVIRTLQLRPGKPVTFAMGEGGRFEVPFFTVNPGGKYRSITVTVPENEFGLSAEQIIRAGAYKRTLNAKWYMDAGKANRFSIDAIPQEAGTCTYSLFTNSDTPLTEVTVELVEHPFPVPKVEMGEKPGALRIKNVPYGTARIRTDNPFGVIYIDHPEFQSGSGFETGDVTPEGDAYFLLPAGLWQVEVKPRKLDTASAVRANFVPVHSGKETVLDWPLAMTAVFGDENGSGIAITTVEGKGKEAEVTFSLQGPETKSIVPDAASLDIKEGGNRAKVLSVKRTEIPLDIVLLVDSSGSMKGQMQNALDATKKFIETLPDTARVQVVDFDTKPKTLPGNTKGEALKGLAGIKANGATCLNDAVLLGLQKLTGAGRPALLLFTDGFDANHNDTGPGSQATKDDVLKAVGSADIPVFTIGFGPGHDVNTLDRIASLSGGRYYAASDPEALDKAFAVIESSLSNTFTARYARPAKGRPSDVPVVTCMVDISGSMNTTPDMAGCNYRIDKVKTILHDFFTGLPDNVLAQAISFWDENTIEQVTTANMGEVLAALNGLDPGGGTSISSAVACVLQTQAAIPSSKRYMLFITDAALQVDDEEKAEFDIMLAKLKDEGIYCLWVGIGALDAAPFKHAADISGGSYILTEDPGELAEAFKTMIQDIRKPVESGKDVKTLVELTLRHREKSGRNQTFATASQATLPAQPVDESVSIPASIAYSLAPLHDRYDAQVSAMVTGDCVPIRDAKIGKRIPMNVTGGNKAASFTVREALFMNRLRGLNPPSGSRYLVLTMDMKNVLPKQKVIVYPDGSNHPASWVGNDDATKGKEVMMVPTYVIPDLKRHLFLRWNNKTMTPVSPATWLTETPLTMPGEDAVAIPPGKPVSGALAFLVPDEIMDQMSLHYYDTNYGHADIPPGGEHDRNRGPGLHPDPQAPGQALRRLFPGRARGEGRPEDRHPRCGGRRGLPHRGGGLHVQRPGAAGPQPGRAVLPAAEHGAGGAGSSPAQRHRLPAAGVPGPDHALPRLGQPHPARLPRARRSGRCRAGRAGGGRQGRRRGHPAGRRGGQGRTGPGTGGRPQGRRHQPGFERTQAVSRLRGHVRGRRDPVRPEGRPIHLHVRRLHPQAQGLQETRARRGSGHAGLRQVQGAGRVRHGQLPDAHRHRDPAHGHGQPGLRHHGRHRGPGRRKPARSGPVQAAPTAIPTRTTGG